MGLVQRVIEKSGTATVSISINKKFTSEAPPPRAVFLKWPLGHPLGEPHRIDQQTKVLSIALSAVEEMSEPGTIVDLPYRWRRHEDMEK